VEQDDLARDLYDDMLEPADAGVYADQRQLHVLDGVTMYRHPGLSAFNEYFYVSFPPLKVGA
jgi:hypothetical protein